MRRLLALVLLTVPTLLTPAGRAADTGAMPSPAGLIANVEHRKTLSLDGAWHYIVDPYDNGYYDYRHQPRKDGFFENAKPKTPRDLVEYDFDRRTRSRCPATGTARRRTCSTTRARSGTRARSLAGHQPGARLFVHFGAVNYFARRLAERRRRSASTRAGSPPSTSRSPPAAATATTSLVVKVEQPAAARGGSDRQDGLVELRRADARRRAGRGPGRPSSRTTSCSCPGARTARSRAGCRLTAAGRAR